MAGIGVPALSAFARASADLRQDGRRGSVCPLYRDSGRRAWACLPSETTVGGWGFVGRVVMG